MLHTLISKSSNAKPFLLYASSFLPGAKELANASMPLSYACQFGMLFDIMIISLFDDSYSALYSSYAKKRLNCVLTLLISRLLRLWAKVLLTILSNTFATRATSRGSENKAHFLEYSIFESSNDPWGNVDTGPARDLGLSALGWRTCLAALVKLFR